MRDCLRAIVDGRVRASREPHWSGPMTRLAIGTEPEPIDDRCYGGFVDSGPETWTVAYEPY